MVKKTNVPLTVVGLMLALLMVSLDQTILSTAIPTIMVKLGGYSSYVWLFSAYLIASTAGMPIFGKLSDMYGRKLFFLLGLILFIVGSALCGSATTMTQLIIFRAIQGVGGGALLPVIFVIIFDLFPPDKRGKVQGIFGAVFGLSSVLGPLAGAFFTDHMNWRWIFYINLPLGIISLVVVFMKYHESLEHKKDRIDWWGTITLIGAILALMFAMELGGHEYAWSSTQVVALFALSILLFALFLGIEKKTKNPLIPLGLFKNRIFTASMGIGFIFGAALMAGASQIPLFIQGVIGGTATNAGLILTPMMISIVVSSFVGGTLAQSLSYRNILILPAIFLMGAAILLTSLSFDSSRSLITVGMILLGLSIGATFPIASIAAQHGITYEQRGVVNSLVRFTQSLGNTVGIAIFGSIQTTHLVKYLSETNISEELKDPQALLTPGTREALPPDVLTQGTQAMAQSITDVFSWLIGIAIIAVLFILLLGNSKMMRTASQPK